MIEPSLPEKEDVRLAYLHSLRILDTKPEQRFDLITQLVASVFAVPVALVSLVDKHRQWFKSKVGIDACETDRRISFCGHAILQNEIFVIEDAASDERFHDNPLVASGPRIRFYAGVPLLNADGLAMGTLCIISPVKRTLSDVECSQLKSFASLVVSELERELVNTVVSELEYSRDEYKSLVNHIPGVTYRCTKDGMVGLSFISEQIYELTGYSAAELCGESKKKSFIDLILAEDVTNVLNRCLFALSHDVPWQINYRIRHADGSIRWVEDRGFIVKDNTGAVIYGEGFVLDVTAEVYSVNVAQRQISALTLLSEISSWADTDQDRLLERVLCEAASHLGAEVALLAERRDRKFFRAVSMSGCIGRQNDSRARLNDFCLNYVSNHIPNEFGDIVVDFQHNYHTGVEPIEDKIHALIMISLREQIYPTVLLFATNNKDQPVYDHSDLIFVQLLAKWISVTLHSKREQKRLNSLISQVPGMLYQFQLFSDQSTCFPYSSPGIEKIYGVTADAVRTDASLVFKKIHPDDLVKVQQSITLSAADLSQWSIHYRTLAENGEIRWLQGNAMPELMDDQSILWHGYIQDVTEQRLIELEREANQKLLESLFELSPVGIALNDLHSGRFIHANQALLAPTGYELDEFLNLDYWQLTPKKYMRLEARQRVALNQMGHYGPIEKEYIRKDGETYPVMLRGVKVSAANGQEMIWSIVENITDRKNSEMLLYEAKLHAEQTSHAKSMFLTNMSHEIRTPLNGILGMLDVLSRSTSMADQKENIGIAISSGKNLLALVDDVLDFSKLESGDIQKQLATVNLEFCFHECFKQYEKTAWDKGLAISTDLTGLLFKQVVTDKRGFSQIMQNLLSNSIKFTHQGRIDLILRSHAIEQQIETVLTVRDTGIGMSAEQMQNLFTAFSQVDQSTTRQFGGVGLGLAIAKKLAFLMNGDIFVKSEPGKGSEFSLIFRASMTGAPSQESENDVHLPKGIKLLLVEDSIVNQQVINAMLEPEKVELVFANNGHSALELLKSMTEEQRRSLNLILMDCLMPKLDGYQTTMRIRSGEVGPYIRHLPIVAITANASAADKQKCIDAGMTDVLTKPVKSQLLIKKILQVLGIQTSSAEEQSCESSGSLSLVSVNIDEEIDTEVDSNAAQQLLWDGDGLSKSLGTMQGMLAKLVQLFLDQTEPQVELLQVAVAEHDAHKLLHLSHTLKGSASQLQCKRLAMIAAEVELTVKVQDWQKLPLLVNSLVKVLTQTREVLLGIK